MWSYSRPISSLLPILFQKRGRGTDVWSCDDRLCVCVRVCGPGVLLSSIDPAQIIAVGAAEEEEGGNAANLITSACTEGPM